MYRYRGFCDFACKDDCVLWCVIPLCSVLKKKQSYEPIRKVRRRQAGSKEFQNFYLSACHFALVLQLDKGG